MSLTKPIKVAIIAGVVVAAVASSLVVLAAILLGVFLGRRPTCYDMVISQPEVPRLYCFGPENQVSVTLEGDGIYAYKGVYPLVNIVGGNEYPIVHGVCDEKKRNCSEITFVIPGTDYPYPMQQNFTVMVNSTSPCTSKTTSTDIALVRMKLSSISPSANKFCVDGSYTIELNGTGFLKTSHWGSGGGGPSNKTFYNAPVVSIGDAKYLVDPEALKQCVPLLSSNFSSLIEGCSKLNFTISESDELEGVFTMTVINPEPFSDQCTRTEQDLQVVIAKRPLITDITPIGTSNGGYTDYVITGEGFLRVDNGTSDNEDDISAPIITVGGDDFYVDPDTLAGCVEVIPGEIARCNNLTISVPSSLVLCQTPVTITNPHPFDECTFTLAPAVATDVEPNGICTALGETRAITIHGNNFSPATRVQLQRVAAGIVVEALSVQYLSDTKLMATFSSEIQASLYDVIVKNPGTCATKLASSVEAYPIIINFFVNPPTLYNGVSIQTTIYTTGFLTYANAVNVTLIGPNTFSNPYNSTYTSLPFTTVNDNPNKILATVPAMLPEGWYDILVTSKYGCQGILRNATKITAALTVAVKDIQPRFGWTNISTSVTITASSSLSGSQVGFQITPLVYISPVNGTSDSKPIPLRAILWASNMTVTASIPENLNPGLYDLIVVNPDGSVGIMTAVFKVTANPPPVIEHIVPQTFLANGDGRAVILGNHFSSTNDTEVSIECNNDATYQATVVNSTSTTTHVVFPLAPEGTVCLVKITNVADQTFFIFSAISVISPSGNLAGWATSPAQLNVARKEHALTYGQPTDSTRYLYTIGGTDANDTARSDIEATSVDYFGNLQGWSFQRNSLPAPITYAGAVRISNFIYVVGGSNGSAAQQTVYRAQILDPLSTTSLTLSVDVVPKSNLTAGMWYYAVSAIFPSDFASNPDGESLPGETLSVRLPDISSSLIGLKLTVYWDSIPDAVAYRVYRTRAANQDPSALEFLGETNNTFWEDLGEATTPGITPLPPGSLGVWHTVDTNLTVPRTAAAVTVSARPSASDEYFIYALGGKNSAGTVLNTYEYARIRISRYADSSNKITEIQTVEAGFVQGNTTLLTSRAEAKALVITNSDFASIPVNDYRLYISQGATQTGTAQQFETAQVDSSGELKSFTALSQNTQVRAGVALYSSGSLYYWGGISSNAITLKGNSGALETFPPYDVSNWNNLGGAGSLLTPRAYMDSVAAGAFYYVVGGVTPTGITNATDVIIR